VTNYRRIKIMIWSCLPLHTFVLDVVEVYVAVLKVKQAGRRAGGWGGRGEPLLSIQGITPDDGQRNCPKLVAFHVQNKFEK
jgi:hypothetical protein